MFPVGVRWPTMYGVHLGPQVESVSHIQGSRECAAVRGARRTCWTRCLAGPS